MAKVIAILNEKGGAGKTTTSTNLASCLAVQHGLRVLLVDHDPQSASSKWAAQRARPEEGHDDPGVIPIISMGETLARDLPALARNYDVVIIDGLPQTDKLTAAAIKVADLVIIPVQPSQYDVWACEPTIELVKNRQEMTGGQPKAAMLVSRAIPNTILESVVRTQLEATGFPIITRNIVNRQAYVQGIAQGLSVMDLPESDKARVEFLAITGEVLELLQ